MEIKTNLEKYLNDYFEVYNLFFPNFENSESHELSVMVTEKENGFNLEILLCVMQLDIEHCVFNMCIRSFFFGEIDWVLR